MSLAHAKKLEEVRTSSCPSEMVRVPIAGT